MSAADIATAQIAFGAVAIAAAPAYVLYRIVKRIVVLTIFKRLYR